MYTSVLSLALTVIARVPICGARHRIPAGQIAPHALQICFGRFAMAARGAGEVEEGGCAACASCATCGAACDKECECPQHSVRMCRRRLRAHDGGRARRRGRRTLDGEKNLRKKHGAGASAGGWGGGRAQAGCERSRWHRREDIGGGGTRRGSYRRWELCSLLVYIYVYNTLPYIASLQWSTGRVAHLVVTVGVSRG